MASSTLGNQRVNRRNHRNGAGCRFLAALGASVLLLFAVGAPIAAAQVPSHDGGGNPGPRGQDGERLREFLERLIQHIRAERHEREGQGTQTQSPPPVVRPPVPPTTPTPVPVTSPPVNGPNVPNVPNLPNLTGATPTATPGAALSARTVLADGTSGSATPAGAGTGATPPDHVASPPAAAPATRSRSPVARALRTARSYGALLALAAAVVIFLLVQGRVDRRDPRILSAPAEEHLTFRDFE